MNGHFAPETENLRVTKEELAPIFEAWLATNPKHSIMFGQIISLNEPKQVSQFCEWLGETVADALEWAADNFGFSVSS